MKHSLIVPIDQEGKLLLEKVKYSTNLMGGYS